MKITYTTPRFPYLSLDHVSDHPGHETGRGYDTDDSDHVDRGPGDVVDDPLGVAAV